MLIPMQAGGESEESIRLLLSLVKFSENTEKALVLIFASGYEQELAAYVCDLKAPNLSRSIKRINEVNHIVEQKKNLDLYHLTDNSQIIKGVSHAPS